MRRTLVILACAALAGTVGAAAAPPSVRLAAGPRTVTASTAWLARIVVKPSSAGRPAVAARLVGARRSAAVKPLGRGRYAIRLVLPTAGTWRLEARLGGRLHRIGTIAVRARTPSEIRIATPAHAALDTAGRLLVVEDGRHRLVRIDPATGRVARVAGTGTILHTGDGGPALGAGLGSPFGLAVAPDGDVFVTSGERLRRIDAAGRISTAAVAPIGLGPLAADARSVFYVAADARIYHLDRASGTVEHVGGTGETGFGGDGGPATAARFDAPHGLALAPDGALLVTDTGNNRLRRIDAATGIVTTVAAGLEGSWGVTLAADGTVYVGAWSANRVYRLTADGTAVLVAGNGSLTSSGDGGPATEAGIPGPVGMAVDARGILYVLESRAGRVRRIDLGTGVVTTLRRP